MGNGASRYKFIRIHLTEPSGIVAGRSCKTILLIIVELIEDAYPVVRRPTEEKVLVGIDSRAGFGRLLE